MNIKAVLFDLDGTLLPMDQDTFVKAYFGYLSKKLYPYGFEPQKLIESIWNGTMLMVKNNGKKTNEEVFWDYFKKIYGNEVMKYHPIFEEYYHNEFQQVKNVCGFNELSKEVIDVLNNDGYEVGLIEVHLYRPFSKEHLINSIPPSVKKIAVLDRTKEIGSGGEPLYLDVVEALRDRDIKVVGGRYGLSSKNTTPAQIKAVFDMLDSDNIKHNFTNGSVH